MKLSRKLILTLALVLSVAMATTGTLAYLTDRDSDTNVFTVGNVDIDLEEKFTYGSELIPGKEVDKYPFIKNIGKNNAYVWAEVAIPVAFDREFNNEAFLMLNNKDDGWVLQEDKKHDNVEINGSNYNIYTYFWGETDSQTVLGFKEPDNKTGYLFETVTLNRFADVDNDGNISYVLAGNKENIDYNVNAVNPVIYVSAYAVQDEGFDNLGAAYDAYMEQWGEQYYKNADYQWPMDPATTVEDIKQFTEEGRGFAVPQTFKFPAQESQLDKNAAGEGATVGLFMNNGGTIDFRNNGFETDAQYGIVTKGGEIFNLYMNSDDADVAYPERAIVINKPNSTIDIGNIHIENAKTKYALNTATYDGNDQELVVHDSYLSPYLSYSSLTNARFENVQFMGGSTAWNGTNVYRNNGAIKSYKVPTEFVNCTFAEGFTFEVQYLKNRMYTFKNCFVRLNDGKEEMITEDNFNDYLEVSGHDTTKPLTTYFDFQNE